VALALFATCVKQH